MKKNFFFLMAIAIMIMSCVKDVESFSPYQYSRVPINSKGEYAIVFGDYNARTKATVGSNSGNGYDSFALYAWNSNNDTIMNPYTVAYGANGYEYDNVGTQELKYFKNTANYYDFIGVIPTTHNMVLENGVAKVDSIKAFSVDDNRRNGVNNITADSPEEFLYAYANAAKSDYNNIVTLPFKHGNAVIYIGLSSDRNDTEILDYAPGVAEIPAIPEVNDTTDTWVNLKRGTNVDGSATKLKGPGESAYTDNVALPAELVNEIKSYYSINNGTPGDYDLHMGNSVWPSAEIRQLRIVKDIPAAYKITVEMYAGVTMNFFNGWKYLKDNGYDIQPRTSGGKPAIWDYILIDAFVNGTAYTVVGLNYGNSQSAPNYTIDVTPGTPGTPAEPALEGIRLFTADSTATEYCKHIAHTLVADANISANGVTYSNRTADSVVVTYSLPATTTLNNTAIWSPTTFYSIPGDENLNYLVVKLSYTYNGITSYDVRVPIKLPEDGLVAGKYYEYNLYITSEGNGTNDPAEARAEKDEIEIKENPVIQVTINVNDYEFGDSQKITI